MIRSLSARRAWIEIYNLSDIDDKFGGSLSARRAWIEIARFARSVCVRPVALRKESVDRNSRGMNIILFTTASLSARRAWIEMSFGCTSKTCHLSLSARRAWIEIVDIGELVKQFDGRSPQGERG